MKISFGRRKLIRDISANTLQTGTTQVFGLLIFYITSRYLSKNDFGELNWSMAIGSTIIAIASLGLDLIFVKKVARRENVLELSGIHFFHTVIVGLSVCTAVYVFGLFRTSFTLQHPVFFFVFLQLAVANVANSFKLCLNGLEHYGKLAVLSLCSNLSRLILIVLLYTFNRFSLFTVVFAYAVSSVVELVIGYLMLSRSVSGSVRPLVKYTEYKYLILESLPQLGVVLFDSALARIDWILLGIISTAAATADYSFVYKIFELSKLPLLVIAPILLTRFAKIFNKDRTADARQIRSIGLFLRLEIFIMMIIPVTLISCWSPLIDFFSAGKYGSVNEANYMLLAACVPMACLINFLWTLGFVSGQLRSIMLITIAVSLLNIALNALLIPLYDSTGAALAFLISTLMQLLMYAVFVKNRAIKPDYLNALLALVNALAAIFVAKLLPVNVIFGTAAALLLYIVFTFLTRQFTVSDWKQIRNRDAVEI